MLSQILIEFFEKCKDMYYIHAASVLRTFNMNDWDLNISFLMGWKPDDKVKIKFSTSDEHSGFLGILNHQ